MDNGKNDCIGVDIAGENHWARAFGWHGLELGKAEGCCCGKCGLPSWPVIRKLPDTFAHRASTLQDIEKRQKTEIDTLNGCIQRIGKKHGVQTPTHDMIVEMIRGIEDIRC